MTTHGADYWAEPKRFPRPPIQAHGMTKDERLAEANKVLQAIANHGHQFFRDKETGAVGRFFFFGGKLHYQDNLPSCLTGNRPHWPVFASRKEWHRLGFSHGGTMESVVRALADFIRGHLDPGDVYWANKRGEKEKDTRLHPGHICPRTIGHKGHRNIWGYGPVASALLRAELRANRAICPLGWMVEPKEIRIPLGTWVSAPRPGRHYILGKANPHGSALEGLGPVELVAWPCADEALLAENLWVTDPREPKLAHPVPTWLAHVGIAPEDELAHAVAMEYGWKREGDRLIRIGEGGAA